MPKTIAALLAIITLLVGSCLTTQPGPINKWGNVIQEGTKATVLIVVEPIGSLDPRPTVGTGFVISSNGYIITNYHVIMESFDPSTYHKIWIKFKDGRSFNGEIIKIIPDSDLALLKIDAKNLEYLELETEYTPQLGDEIITIGNAYPFFFYPTSGIISGLESSNNVYVMNITAPINSGCSGGPILNSNGKVVGVITAMAQAHRGIYIGIELRSIRLLLKNLPIE